MKKREYRLLIEVREEEGAGHYNPEPVEIIKFRSDSENLDKLIRLIKSKLKPTQKEELK